MADFVLLRMGELGILGIFLPVRYGGQGMDYISLGLAYEELEAVDTSLRVVMSVHVGLNSIALFQWATEEEKQQFLKPQAEGKKIACFGLNEPGAGTDESEISSTARRDGSDYVLNGEKMWISPATKVHHCLWVGRTDRVSANPYECLSAYLVELDSPDLSTGDIHGKLGVRAGSTGWIAFQDAHVPTSNRISEEGEGFKIAMSCLDNGRNTVGSGATGLIRACLEAGISYSKERHVFGQEIAKMQLVQQKITKMVHSYDMARLLYLRSDWMKNLGLRNTRETSLSKWFATDASFEAANEAVQIHGAYDHSADYEVECYLRNSKGAVIYEGTSEIRKLIQAGYTLGYRVDAPLRCELPSYDPAIWSA